MHSCSAAGTARFALAAALMLIMFVVGSANIGWMLALGAVMAAEKNLPLGRRLAAPLGALLLLAALWTALAGAIA